MRQGQRLTEAERADVHRRIRGGETFARAAAAVGCSTRGTVIAAPWNREADARPYHRMPIKWATRDIRRYAVCPHFSSGRLPPPPSILALSNTARRKGDATTPVAPLCWS